ncbi:MAG: type II secretion system protein [bacterium]|nr:type II secretion system protein [bacterium]
MQKHNGFTLAEVLLTLVIIGTVAAYTIPSVIYDHQNRDVALGYQKAINNLNKAYSAYFNSPPTDKSSGNAYKFAKTHYGSNGEILDESGNAESDSNPVIKYDWVDDGNRYEIGEANKLDSVYKILDKIVVKHLPVVNIRSISDSKVTYLTIATDTKTLYDTTTMAACSSETTPIEYFYTTDGMRYCISYEYIENNETFGEDTYGVIWVDTNGEKTPNEVYKNINSTGKAIYTGDTLPITILKDRFVPGHPTKSDFNTAAQNLFFNKK